MKEIKRLSIEYERYNNNGKIPCLDASVVDSGTQEYFVNTLRTSQHMTDVDQLGFQNISDKDYMTGYRMYIYLISCQSQEQIDTSYAWVQFYRKLFDKNSRHTTRTILQTITNNMNKKIRNGQSKNLIEQGLLKKITQKYVHSLIEDIALAFPIK